MNSLLQHVFVPSTEDKEFFWPIIGQIHGAQSKYASKSRLVAKRKGSDAWKVSNRTWILEDADGLQLRLLIIEHCSTGGHHGTESTENVLMEYFT